MTFMKKFMDILNINNWNKKDIDFYQDDNAKWSSIREPEAMKVEAETMDLKKVTIYFKNGRIIRVVPDVYDYYKAQYYNIDGKTYDTYSIPSIINIPVPNYSKREALGTPVYNLEYLLRMRASQERKRNNNELAYALLEKSTFLMKYTGTYYNYKDFFRIANWLYQDGKIQEAKKVESELSQELSSIYDISSLHSSAFQKVLKECTDIKTDYIYCSCHHGTCPECAKYQCRVYCISGKDKRFPKLPDIVKQFGGFHEGCRHTFYPFFLHIDKVIKDSDFNSHEVFEYSNRPFVDDRTEYDKQLHLERLENQRKRMESAHNKEMYYLLKEKMPDKMPKSLSGFTRMKNANSKNYQTIVQAAKEIGIDIT